MLSSSDPTILSSNEVSEKSTFRTPELPLEVSESLGSSRNGYTVNDQHDMRRMGKRQELLRNFKSLSALSFTVILSATWEFMLIANTQGLVDGGLAGLFWSFIWTFVGFWFVMLSLAEMSSMAPTSGGQYHWVSEFAPPNCQKFLSYVTGWMALLSWQAGAASGSFLTGTIIQGLISLNNPSYEPTNWQGTLLIFAMVAILYIANVWCSNEAPAAQNVLLALHMIMFIVLLVIFAVKSPHASARAVFTEFTNSGGWSNMGVSVMVGQITAIYGLFCGDATVHMSEEITDAGVNVPNAMIRAYLLNGIVAFFFFISYLFTMTSIDDALNDPTGYPFIWVFRNCVSTAGVNVLTTLILILVVASNISFNASTARITFAFARDKGLPFSKWIAKVDEKRQIPVHAIQVTCAINVLLSLINIGSSVAFNAIISVQLVALMLAYLTSISCVLYRRIKQPHLLPKAAWSLGKHGVLINVLALIYVFWAFFWSFWPNTVPVDASSFNWSVVIFMAVFILSLVMYYLEGRKIYDGPVVLVDKTAEE